MIEALPYLVSGILFGVIAGLSPGPLLALVITETIRHGKKQGIKVALTPLISDVPVIVITLLLLSKLRDFETVLGVISLLGAGFVVYLGYETITARGLDVQVPAKNSRPLRKGILVNTFSPHPYVFWLTIGASILSKTQEVNLIATIGFMALFYGMLVGSKIMVALLIHRSRSFLKGKIYLWAMRLLGLSLLGFAWFFVAEGLRYLGIM